MHFYDFGVRPTLMCSYVYIMISDEEFRIYPEKIQEMLILITWKEYISKVYLIKNKKIRQQNVT